FANDVPACRYTYDTVYEPCGLKPGRSSGTRTPSLPSTGLADAPATSTDTIVAPSGRLTFRNGCARFCNWRITSVNARPSAVIIVVAVAHSAYAARTPASANRFASIVNPGITPGMRW